MGRLRGPRAVGRDISALVVWLGLLAFACPKGGALRLRPRRLLRHPDGDAKSFQRWRKATRHYHFSSGADQYQMGVRLVIRLVAQLVQRQGRTAMHQKTNNCRRSGRWSCCPRVATRAQEPYRCRERATRRSSTFAAARIRADWVVRRANPQAVWFCPRIYRKGLAHRGLKVG